jgi:hypothetical protein
VASTLRRLALPVAFTMLAVLLLGTVWYRATYHVWPGQGAGTRIHWCGRNYDGGDGPPQSAKQIKSTYGGQWRTDGGYPPLGPRRGLLVPRPGTYCPTVIFLSVGPDRYLGYALSGGP